MNVIGERGWVCEPKPYRAYRYLLGEIGKRPLVCVGLNPSIAWRDQLDNTLKRVRNIAMNGGYSGWMMLNLYPQRATHPRDLANRRDVEWMNCNYRVIDNVFRQIREVCGYVDVWCAWGGIVRKRSYLCDCVRNLADVGSRYSVTWLRRGKETKKGDPHHPLYVRNDEPLLPFDMVNYLRKLK